MLFTAPSTCGLQVIPIPGGDGTHYAEWVSTIQLGLYCQGFRGLGEAMEHARRDRGRLGGGEKDIEEGIKRTLRLGGTVDKEKSERERYKKITIILSLSLSLSLSHTYTHTTTDTDTNTLMARRI